VRVSSKEITEVSDVRAGNSEGTNLKRQLCSTDREARICNGTLKITREMEGQKTITIEKKIGKLGKDSSDDYSRHTHDIEESLRCKRPELHLSIAQQRGKRTTPLLKFLVLCVELGWRKDQTYLNWLATRQ
jgi:hypothetical protein